MFSNEVIPMAVKKSTAPKGGAKTKVANKKATPKAKAAPKVKAAPKAKAPKAPKTGAKKAAPKKAAGPKLTDAQKRMLGEFAQAKEAGILGSKGNAKVIEGLLKHKLIKKGKKEGKEFFRYHITKSGEKHSAAPVGGPASTPEPSSPPAM
jgi:hypothetical protein